MTDRYFPNQFSDYNGEQYLNSEHQLVPELSSPIIRWIEQHLEKLERHIGGHSDPSDGSVYTGSAGVAFLYWRLAQLFPTKKEHYTSRAKVYVDAALGQLDGKRATFLCGDAGPLAIGAAVYNDVGDDRMVRKYCDRIMAMISDALEATKPDEYLNGRAGYLYSLMFLREHIQSDIVNARLITHIFEAMIRSGENYAKQSRSSSPLMYQWHGKEYLGAAHGVSGILFLLLKVAHDPTLPHLRSYVNSHLLPTIEHLKSKRLPSGNYLSSNNSTSDHLVQWCHGAPGFAYLFARTHELTGQPEYLNLAMSAGDTVWQRGLLTKGYGLCHGTAGNGYVFLNLYRTTNEIRWLHRAIKFAEHCLSDDRHHLARKPDHPYSLFEGLAGTICFLADLLHPGQARFPAFE